MKSTVLTAFFIAILLYISFHFLLILSPFSGPILFAAILAFGFHPLYLLIGRWVKNEAVASILTVLLVLSAVIPFTIGLVGSVSDDAIRGAEWLTNWVKNKEYIRFIDWAATLPLVDRLQGTQLFDRLKAEFGDWTSNSLATWGGFAAAQAAQLTKNTLLLIMNALLTVFFFFLFLKDGLRIMDFITRILPLEGEGKREVMGQLRETFAAVIHGQVVSAAVKAALVGVVFWAMGLPLPVLFAVITVFASLLPIVGSAVVWFPFVAYLASQGQYGKAGVLFVIGAVVISSVDNLIQPFIIGKRSGLPYALLLVGIVGGVAQYGIFGIFIGPLVISLFFALIRIYRVRFLDKPATPASAPAPTEK